MHPRVRASLGEVALLQPSLGVRSWEPDFGDASCVPSEASPSQGLCCHLSLGGWGSFFSPLFHSSAVQWLWTLASNRAGLGQQLAPYWEGWAHCLHPLLSFCFLWEVKMIIVALYVGWDDKDHTYEGKSWALGLLCLPSVSW